MHPAASTGAATRADSQIPGTVVMAATRIWREAIDRHAPVLPSLHALLGPAGYDMLAPVFDSVMRLCERHFDRRLCAGCPLKPSGDEALLCRLIADPTLLDRVGPCRASVAMGAAFATALRSLQVMLALGADETALNRAAWAQ